MLLVEHQALGFCKAPRDHFHNNRHYINIHLNLNVYSPAGVYFWESPGTQQKINLQRNILSSDL